jgi:beta-lactamase regulating signal transducer with metallopeptidase domain
MITPGVILFSLAAAAFVWFAGRRDAARDPRLTVLVLLLLAGFPLLAFLPKVRVDGAWVADFPGTSVNWAIWLGWMWAAGVAVFSLRLVAALVQLTGWRRRSMPVTDADFAGIKPEIRLLEGLACPVAAGVFRPLILVPPAWQDWTPELRKTVVAHEAAHHARRDPLWRAIAAVACTLHWWNPLVWWMAARLADQCEYACDERVVNGGLPPRGYAGDLLRVAAACRAPATTLAMAGSHGLEARVRRMLALPSAWSPARVACLAALAFSSAVALAVLERGPADTIPRVDAEEIRTRLSADPFPGN